MRLREQNHAYLTTLFKIIQINVRVIVVFEKIFRYTAKAIPRKAGGIDTIRIVKGGPMHAMVTARVPVEIRDQVNVRLREIGSSPTELVNAAYDYVLATGELPDANRTGAPLSITLTDDQANELRFRFRHATHSVPLSFWEHTQASRTAAKKEG